MDRNEDQRGEGIKSEWNYRSARTVNTSYSALQATEWQRLLQRDLEKNQAGSSEYVFQVLPLVTQEQS